MTLENIFHKTEKLLIESTSEIKEINSNYYFQSLLFPQYHGGNGMVILNDYADGNLAFYMRLYSSMFNHNQTIHITFYSLEKKINQQNDLGLKPTLYQVMCLKNSVKNIKYPLEKITDFEELLSFEKQAEDNPWFHEEGFKKKIKISHDLAITWLGIKEVNLKSVCGYFVNEDIRLQDLQTLEESKRKGMASSIITYINKLEQHKNIYVYVDAENNEAISTYNSIGFKKINGHIIEYTVDLSQYNLEQY